MAKVVLQSLNAKYGEFHAVKDMSLTIEDKEFVVLVGPSGCGKTTTLRMVAGLSATTSGEIFINDRPVSNVEAKDRDIAMVFQNYALYPHMNVYDNMAFGLKMRRFPGAEIRQRVNEAADILGLGELLTRKPRELSGGQRQRVALGRAIVRRPQVFLFDEPLSNLDAKLRVQMRSELKRLHGRLSATVIYVTHDQVEAMTLGSRVVVMKDGCIQQVGDPLEIYSRPVNQFVAGFMGSPSMNFIAATLAGAEGELQAEFDGFRIPLPSAPAGLRKYQGKDVILGIRPEFLAVVSAPFANCVPAIVEVVEPLGSEILLELEVGHHNLVARVDVGTRVAVRDRLHVAFDPGHLHFFDVTTGNAVV